MEELLLEPIAKSKRGIIGDALMDLIKNSKNKLYFVSPYIGEWINYKKELRKIKDVRIICQIESSGTNPYLIQELLKTFPNIRFCEEIHAKVYLSEASALLGSANLTEPGMGKGNIESAMKINESGKLEIINNWFLKLWEDKQLRPASRISPEKWRVLKANYDNREIERNKRSNIYKHFFDELITGELSQVVFVFYYESENGPSQEDAHKVGISKNFPFPDNDKEWNSWLERECDKKELPVQMAKFKEIYKKYRDATVISIEYEIKDNKIYKFKRNLRRLFVSKFFGYPVRFDNNKIITFYRILNEGEFEFSIDKKKSAEFINILNTSLNKNKAGWKGFENTKECEFGTFCEPRKLFELIKSSI